jgi:hypothetical protein
MKQSGKGLLLNNLDHEEFFKGNDAVRFGFLAGAK